MAMDLVAFFVLLAVVLIGFVALGSVQAVAIAKGLARHGYGKAPAASVALLLAFMPIVGGTAAVLGARSAWGWSAVKGSLWFFGSLLALRAVVALG